MTVNIAKMIQPEGFLFFTGNDFLFVNSFFDAISVEIPDGMQIKTTEPIIDYVISYDGKLAFTYKSYDAIGNEEPKIAIVDRTGKIANISTSSPPDDYFNSYPPFSRPYGIVSLPDNLGKQYIIDPITHHAQLTGYQIILPFTGDAIMYFIGGDGNIYTYTTSFGGKVETLTKYSASEPLNLISSTSNITNILIKQNSINGTAIKTIELGENFNTTTITFTFDWMYDDFPGDIELDFIATYTEKKPFASIILSTPDDRNLRISDFAIEEQVVYYISQDTKLRRRLAGLQPQQGIFIADPKSGLTTPVKGTYHLIIQVYTFEQDSSVDVAMVIYGK